ncbi:hypothetical protein L345_15734, partial [Ophiophagus hannah]
MVRNRSHILTLLSIQDDDFYPNLFWAEVRLRALTPKTLGIEAYDLTRFQMLNPSGLSFVQWIKEPRPLTLRDNQAVVIADGVEKMEISGLTESSFGYVRALVYDFHSEVPGRVLVAERLFFIKKGSGFFLCLFEFTDSVLILV